LRVDWHAVFVPTVPVLETVVRGTVVYLVLLVLLRFVLKREAGTLGVQDLLVIVLIADAAQNAMAADYHSVSDGVILVATIIAWSYALDWLGFHSPRAQRLLHPPPLALVEDGRLLRRNMRQELVTADELMSQLRLQGIEDFTEVKAAYMEGDGRISVVPRSGTKPVGAPIGGRDETGRA
jgi:uncharacterized membrane protein YcaP (DUF421 family)